MSDFLESPKLLLLIGDAVSIYLCSYMHRTFYEKRDWAKKYSFLVLLVYLVDLVIGFSANLLEYPPVNLANCIITYFIPLVICYRFRNVRGFVYWVFYFFGTMLMEIVLGLSLGRFTNNMKLETQYDAITPHVAVIMNLIELLIVLGICRFGKKEDNSRINRVSLFFMLIPFISVVLIIGDLFVITAGKVKNFNPNQFMWTATVLLIVNIMIFVLLEKYTSIIKRDMELSMDKIKLQSDADIMSLAAKSMKERLDISEQMVQQDRLMRHDRRHFEATLLALLQNGKNEEAIKSLEERLAVEPRTTRKYCDNTTVNAAISHYLSKAEEEGIKVSADLNIPSDFDIDEMEMAITISNLLENAIKGCKNVPENEKYIKITSRYKKQLLLEIMNSCEENVKLDKNGYPFTKEKNHGIGTRSVLAFANKTQSQVFYSVNNKEFSVRLIINVKNK